MITNIQYTNKKQEYYGFLVNKTLYNNSVDKTHKTIKKNDLLGVYAPFTKVFIIKGIGYQADIIDNSTTVNTELNNRRYLFLRVGHSFNCYKAIPNFVNVKIGYKERKIIIFGSNKNKVFNFAKTIYELRPPSVYTGRGIRAKRQKHKRKLGKKDIKKGRI